MEECQEKRSFVVRGARQFWLQENPHLYPNFQLITLCNPEDLNRDLGKDLERDPRRDPRHPGGCKSCGSFGSSSRDISEWWIQNNNNSENRKLFVMNVPEYKSKRASYSVVQEAIGNLRQLLKILPKNDEKRGKNPWSAMLFTWPSERVIALTLQLHDGKIKLKESWPSCSCHLSTIGLRNRYLFLYGINSDVVEPRTVCPTTNSLMMRWASGSETVFYTPLESYLDDLPLSVFFGAPFGAPMQPLPQVPLGPLVSPVLKKKKKNAIGYLRKLHLQARGKENKMLDYKLEFLNRILLGCSVCKNELTEY